MVNGTESSGKQRLLANRDSLERLRIDGHAQAGVRQRRRPAAQSKSQNAITPGIMNEMAIIGALQVTQIGNCGSKMPAGGRENRRLSYLASKLAADAILPRELCQPQRWNIAAAFGQAQIKKIADTVRDHLASVDH